MAIRRDELYNPGDYEEAGEEWEVATARLESGQLDDPKAPSLSVLRGGNDGSAPGEGSSVDWVATLTSRRLAQHLPSETPSQFSGPTPLGMSQHASAARMVPTRGSRLASFAGRAFLLCAVGLFAVATFAGGAYLLIESGWLGNGSPAPAPITSPAKAPPSSAPAPQNNSQPSSAQAPSVLPDSQDKPAPAQPAPPLSSEVKQILNHGIDEFKHGKYESAIKLFESYLNVNGDDSIAYYQLGLSYAALPDRPHSVEDAEMAFRTAASLEPQWAAPNAAIAETLLRRNYFNEAIAPALKATQLDPRLAEGWLALGRAYQGAGQPTEATRAFAEAARIAPPPPTQP